MRFFIGFFIMLFVSFTANGQEKFDKKQTDSIYKKYTNIQELGKDRKKSIKEIDAILPRISDNYVKLDLMTTKTVLYGTSIKDQPQILKSHLEAKEIAEKLDGKREKVMIHLALAETYKNLKMYQLATENLKIVEDLMEGQDMTPEKWSLIYMGHFMELDVLFSTKKYQECIKEAKFVLNTADKLTVQNHRQFAKMLSNQYIGRCYLELKNYSEAEKYLQTAIALEKDALPDFKIRDNTAYAQLLYETNRVGEAKEELEAFHNDKLMDYPEEAIARFSILSKVYAKLGDNDRFDFYVKKKDSLDQAYKEMEMSSVEQAQKFIEAENHRKVESKNKIIWILAPLIFIAIGLIIYYKVRKDSDRKKFEAIIEKIKNDELSNSFNVKTDESKENEILENYDEAPEKEIAASSLNAEKSQVILNQLSKFEDKEKFKDPNLSLADLASQFKTNTSYLSEVINKNKNKNFNTYINELRINYIVKKLYNNPEYLNYKISYLAEDSGFASHSAFATVFKNTVGISPSVFIQNLKK